MTAQVGIGATRGEVEPRQLRILLITDKVPALANGYAMRVGNVIQALRSAGRLHACLVDSSDGGTAWTDIGDAQTSVVRASNPGPLSDFLRFPLRLPNNVRYAHEAELCDRILAAVGDSAWDVVWCSGARVQTLTAALDLGPRIVDLYDLNDGLLRSEIRDRVARCGWLSTMPRNARDWLDIRLWSRLQLRIARTADRIVVCSAADRRQLGVANCSVVPNAYPDPEPLPGGIDPPSTHRLIVVGSLHYEPNRLAVRWFVNSVLPRIRADVPDAELMVIGDHAGVPLKHLTGPGVSFAGLVPDVGPYYADAAVAVVPLHSGAGTRLKVIEALARGVPLVSTTFGCYGYDILEPGRDLLIADDEDDFAAACVSLLNHRSLRRPLAAAGRARYVESLTPDVTTDVVGVLVNAVANGDRVPVAWGSGDTHT